MTDKTGFKPMVYHADFIMQAVRLVDDLHGRDAALADLRRSFPSITGETAIALLDGSMVLAGNTEDGFEVHDLTPRPVRAEEGTDNG